MEMYGQKDTSIPEKTAAIILEVAFLWISYLILFGDFGNIIVEWLGIENGTNSLERRIIIFSFSVIIFLRMGFTMFFLLKRKIVLEENITVPLAYAIYFIGFPILALPADSPINYIDCFGIFLFLIGSFINTYSELQRHFWKKQPQNKGKLYTKGLFKYSMHINYFGDVLWVTAYAIITRNWYSAFIPTLLFLFLLFYNIPKLDGYIAKKVWR